MRSSDFIIKTAKKIISLLPKRNIITFESLPDFSDNTKVVFDEMIKRGYNKKYKLVWVLDKDDNKDNDIFSLKNCYCISHYSSSITERIKRIYTLASARLLITSNIFVPKYSPKQYYLNLTHGAAIKSVSGYYGYPNSIDNAVGISDYLCKSDSLNFNFDFEKFVPLGFPRNDELFKKVDIKAFFKEKNFKKVIYWMPTYRQHKSTSKIVHSSISIPIIYDKNSAEKLNDYAESKGVLLVIKPHPAQDLSKLTAFNLSNIVFIDDSFFVKNKISNYAFLGNCDALLTDYSSVYYDFMLTDKPIGLCWEDYDEYSQREGFCVDMDFVMAGGEKIYTLEDMMQFISDVASGIDNLKQKRNELLPLLHKYTDNKSAQRVVDYIAKNGKTI